MTQRAWALGRPVEAVAPGDPFGLPVPSIEPVTTDAFVGQIGARAPSGAVSPVACATWVLTPHAHATHTETSLHVDPTGPPLAALAWPIDAVCAVLHLSPELLGDTAERGPQNAERNDLVLTGRALRAGLSALASPTAAGGGPRALALLTPAAPAGHAPYLTHEAMDLILALGVEHLLLSPPSVDRADDQGALRNHRTFWGLAEGTSGRAQRATITENIVCRGDGAPPAGMFRLLVAPILAATDAAPSNPILTLLSEPS